MKLKVKGQSININEPLVLKVTRYEHKMGQPSYCLILNSDYELSDKYESAIIISAKNKIKEGYKGKVIYKLKDLTHLSEDDIICINPSGTIRTLYRVNSNQNMLLLTERCNSNCLMCSQPPKDKDDTEYLFNIYSKLIPLIPKNCVELNLTGGEPTLLGDKLFKLLKLIKDELPSTEIHMLTNGRLFSIDSFAQNIAAINNPRMMLGIPLYSDYYQIHDYVVQSKDAYYQTIMGIHNLKRYNIRIEIRVVLHKITIPRLKKLAEYIYRNISFVDQVVFMGLEIMGYTKTNLNDLWVDPVEYMEELEKAVTYLNKKQIPVSIYNTPLCILPIDLWEFNRNSISDWKNIYFEKCNDCSVISKCGGFFESSLKKHSESLKPFDSDPSITNNIICS